MDFSTAADIYQHRGFRRRLGFGGRPALLHIDLAYAWTQPDGPFACQDMDEVVAGAAKLNAAATARNVPVFYTTTAFDVPRGEYSDAGLWQYKIPVDELRAGSPATEIDRRLTSDTPGQVVVKKRASAFHGTHLSGLLRAGGVDTVLITGVTATGCVRHSAEDAISEGFRPMVIRECVSDRIPEAVEWNLFDIDAKFGDVVGIDEAIGYLDGLAARSQSTSS